jgi:hypothetical protein
MALHTSSTTRAKREHFGKSGEAHGTFFAEMESPRQPVKRIRI